MVVEYQPLPDNGLKVEDDQVVHQPAQLGWSKKIPSHGHAKVTKIDAEGVKRDLARQTEFSPP